MPMGELNKNGTDLTIEVADDGSLVLEGIAERGHQDSLEKAVEERVRQEGSEVVIDVSHLRDVDSSFLGLASVTALRLGRQGRRLAILNCSPHLDRVLSEAGLKTLPALLIVAQGSERAQVTPVSRETIWRWLYRDALQHRVAAKCNCMIDAYETIQRLAEHRDWNAEQVRAAWEERPACPRLEDLSAAD